MTSERTKQNRLTRTKVKSVKKALTRQKRMMEMTRMVATIGASGDMRKWLDMRPGDLYVFDRPDWRG